MAATGKAIEEYRLTCSPVQQAFHQVEVWRELFAKMSLPKDQHFQKAVIQEEM